MTVTFDVELVYLICRDTISATHDTPVRDPLDDTVWVSLPSWPHAQEARRALAEFGLASCDGHDARLHVTGWDDRLLRRRLATVLAGVDDLTVEWDATVELATTATTDAPPPDKTPTLPMSSRTSKSPCAAPCRCRTTRRRSAMSPTCSS